MKQKFINLYTTELKRLEGSDTRNFAAFNKNKICAMKNMITFLNTASNKELEKLPSIMLKFTQKSYISSDELKFIQTRYYNLVKYNSIKGSKNNKNNVSYIFGFIEEIDKGYCVALDEKVYKNNSIYKITKESNNFMAKIVLMLKDYTTIIKEQDNKLFIRSLKKFKNVKIQNIEPNKDYIAPFYYNKERIEAIDYIQNIELLVQTPSKNPEGRVYNKYWNALKKEDKINLFPSYTSYDINTSLYQFLFQEARRLNLKNTKIKHYIDNKQELRKFIPKDDFNSLPYKVEKGYIINGKQYLQDLGKEVKDIVYKIIGISKTSLFKIYEIWESKVLQDFIDKNNLTHYITNHDEILVHSKHKVNYVPNIFGIETVEERGIISKEYNSKSQEDFIKERELRIKTENRFNTIRHYKSVLKRTKNATKRIDYFLRIESLDVSYNENLLSNSFSV